MPPSFFLCAAQNVVSPAHTRATKKEDEFWIEKVPLT